MNKIYHPLLALIASAADNELASNPDWKATHQPAQHTAWAIDILVKAGATMTGKTHTDELTRGIWGENVHYGTPINPRAKNRVPGGSSSGSAVAVAAGIVDFSLGSDTGGSMRIPASFCGLYGIRPSHGRISLAGCFASRSQLRHSWLVHARSRFVCPSRLRATAKQGSSTSAPSSGHCN